MLTEAVKMVLFQTNIEADFQHETKWTRWDDYRIWTDLELEHEALPMLKDAIEHCEKVRDYVSRDLFTSILDSEEDHVDMLEQQFDMIERMGLENYCQLQSEPAEED
jgi:bacterioferritin